MVKKSPCPTTRPVEVRSQSNGVEKLSPSDISRGGFATILPSTKKVDTQNSWTLGAERLSNDRVSLGDVHQGGDLSSLSVSSDPVTLKGGHRGEQFQKWTNEEWEFYFFELGSSIQVTAEGAVAEINLEKEKIKKEWEEQKSSISECVMKEINSKLEKELTTRLEATWQKTIPLFDERIRDEVKAAVQNL